MSGHLQRSSAPKRLYHATIHTCTKTNRYKILKGLAALVIDVTMGSGDSAFALPHDLYRKYLHAGSSVAIEAWEDEVKGYFRQLKERYPVSWLRLLHNPNIAFMEKTGQSWSTSGLLTPRMIVAQHFVTVMEEAGYKFTWGEKK